MRTILKKFLTYFIEKYSMIIFIIIPLIFFSCVSQKYNYVQMSKSDIGALFEQNIPKYKVKPYDMLNIIIRSKTGEGDQYFTLMGNNQQGIQSSGNTQIRGFLVSDTGYVEIPTLGYIKVEDLTVDEIKDKLEEILDSFYDEVIVRVELMDFPITFLGEVKGHISTDKRKINILEAIGQIGGIPNTGNKKEIHVFRNTGDSTLYFTLDLTQKDILTSENYYLRPNDIIYIEPLPLKKIRLEYADIMFILSSATTLLTTILLITKL